MLEERLRKALTPTHLELIDESGGHTLGVNSHYHCIVASEKFSGLSLVERHQMIYTLLKEEMASQIHALRIDAFTPEEWEKKNIFSSPACLGKRGK